MGGNKNWSFHWPKFSPKTLTKVYINDTEKYIQYVNNTIKLCNRTNWRLPTSKELFNIIHFGNTKVTADEKFFPNIAGQFFWTGTLSSTNLPWNIYFNGVGTMWENVEAIARTYSDESKFSVMLVSSINTSSPGLYKRDVNDMDSYAYKDNNDGTLTHLSTGLTWKRCLEGQTWNGTSCDGNVQTPVQTLNWSQALATAKASRFAGKTDWRLPNIKELFSLVQEWRTSPMMYQGLFPAGGNEYLLSSTTCLIKATVSKNSSTTTNVKPTDYVWEIHYNSGQPGCVRQTWIYPVRLVRGP